MEKKFNYAWAIAFLSICGILVQAMHPIIPTIIGWPIVGVLLIVSIFLIVKGIREKDLLVPTIDFDEWGIGMTGHREYPKVQGEEWLLYLEVSTYNFRRKIDTLDIEIEGERIPVILPCEFRHRFPAYFKVTKWWQTGEHQVELIANATSDPISSGRKPLDFSMEPFSRLPI